MARFLALSFFVHVLLLGCAGSNGESEVSPPPAPSPPAPSSSTSSTPPKGDLGSPCKGDADCKPYLTCQGSLTELGSPLRCQQRPCYDQEHCPEGQDCLNGICAEKPACRSAKDCPEGLTCINGTHCAKLGDCP